MPDYIPLAFTVSLACCAVGLWFLLTIFLAASRFNRFYVSITRTVSPEDFLKAVAAIPGTVVFCANENRICKAYVRGFYLDTESAEPLELPESCVCLPVNGPTF